VKVQIRQAKNGEWYFVAIGANNEDGPVSETYTRREDAVRAAGDWWPGVEVEE